MRIHGHPQKTDYNDSSEWPTVSFQGHWTGPGLTPMPMADQPGVAHTHIDIKAPVYAEVDAPFVCQFTVKLFHTQGHFGGFYTSLIRDIVWDETGNSTVPTFIGDPMGLVQKSGHFTVDLAMPTYYPNKLHGWAGIMLTGVTGYSNGDVVFTSANVPFFSMLNPALPEPPFGNGGGPVLWTQVQVANTTVIPPATSPVNYGATLVEVGNEVLDFIPIAPISAPWHTNVGTNGYGNADLPPADFEQRFGVDFHAGIAGTVVQTATGLSTIARPVTLDPAQMGLGTKNAVFFRRQTDGPEIVYALLVFNVTVEAGVPVDPPVTIATPNVVGMTPAAAQTQLMAVGLTTGSVATGHDSMVPAGNIISQSPGAGVQVVLGTHINLNVSTGPVITPDTGEVWTMATPKFMQLVLNGVPQDRWKICDPDEPMVANNCPEVVTTPTTPVTPPSGGMGGMRGM